MKLKVIFDAVPFLCQLDFDLLVKLLARFVMGSNAWLKFSSSTPFEIAPTDLNVSSILVMPVFVKAKKFLAFTETLRNIVLDYVKSVKYGIGLLLSESLMPVLQYIYRDLTRTGLRDHLLGYTHGLSEDMSTFSTHLMYYLGELSLSHSKTF